MDKQVEKLKIWATERSIGYWPPRDPRLKQQVEYYRLLQSGKSDWKYLTERIADEPSTAQLTLANSSLINFVYVHPGYPFIFNSMISIKVAELLSTHLSTLLLLLCLNHIFVARILSLTVLSMSVDCYYISFKGATMAKTETIQARIAPEVKKQAQEVFAKLHITMSEAISLYLTQIALHQGIPFEIKIPNRLTAKILKESENGENLNEVSDVDNLMEELESWESNIRLNLKKISRN